MRKVLLVLAALVLGTIAQSVATGCGGDCWYDRWYGGPGTSTTTTTPFTAPAPRAPAPDTRTSCYPNGFGGVDCD